MVERINAIVNLDPNEGLNYVQWGLMRVYVGADFPYIEWRQQARSPNVFSLEKPPPGSHYGPFGLIEVADGGSK